MPFRISNRFSDFLPEYFGLAVPKPLPVEVPVEGGVPLPIRVPLSIVARNPITETVTANPVSGAVILGVAATAVIGAGLYYYFSHRDDPKKTFAVHPLLDPLNNFSVRPMPETPPLRLRGGGGSYDNTVLASAGAADPKSDVDAVRVEEELRARKKDCEKEGDRGIARFLTETLLSEDSPALPALGRMLRGNADLEHDLYYLILRSLNGLAAERCGDLQYPDAAAPYRGIAVGRRG